MIRSLGRWAVAVSLLSIVAGCQLRSATSPVAISGPMALPSVRVPHSTSLPAMDASLKGGWSQAVTLQPMTPSIGTPASDKTLPTEVRLQWDEQNLYVRFVCQCDGPPYAPFGDKHDALHYQGDAVEVFLDPVGDGRQYFEIQVSPAGGVLDQNTTITTTPRYGSDGVIEKSIHMTDFWPNISYDIKGLRVATSVQKQGNVTVWVTDLALPVDVLKRLGKSKFEPMTLRMNFLRYHWTGPIDDKSRRLIPMNWSPVLFGCPHSSADRMGVVQLVAK